MMRPLPRHCLLLASLALSTAPVDALDWTPIEAPLSAPEIPNPLRGWFSHYDSRANSHVDAATLDDYRRFGWFRFETTFPADNRDADPTNDYDFGTLESFLRAAAARGQKGALRVRALSMSLGENGTGTETPRYLRTGRGFWVDLDKDKDANTTHAFDVTAHVAARLAQTANAPLGTPAATPRTVSFRIEATDNAPVLFRSREYGTAAQRPMLAVTIDGAVATLTAVADGYVRSDGAASGSADFLEIKDGGSTNWTYRTFLRFDLSGLPPGSASQAMLRLHCHDMSGITNVEVYAAATEDWTETGLAWNAHPARGALLTRQPIGTHGSKETFVPDWNDPYFLERARLMLRALGARYDGDPRIAYIDIGMYGTYGEWHTSPILYSLEAPPGMTQATPETMRAIVDMHLESFPRTRLVMMTQQDVAVQHALLQPHGPAGRTLLPIGLRRDSLGSDIFDQFNARQYPLAFAAGAADRWKIAPFIAEPINPLYSGAMVALAREQTARHRVSAINNINFVNYLGVSEAAREEAKLLGRETGYRLSPMRIHFPDTLRAGDSFTVRASWKNTGVAPVYEPFEARYRLRRAETTAAWESPPSSFAPAGFPPTGALAREFADTWTLPAGLAPGLYEAALLLSDASGAREPLRLAIEGTPDKTGAYALGTVRVEAGEEPQIDPNARLTNLSVRTRLSAGQTVVAGITVSGAGAKRLLVRVVGPGLADFGVAEALADPALELFSGAERIDANDDWDPELADTMARAGAFALRLRSRDAALVRTLPPGLYTVQARSRDTAAAGELLIEVFEL